ncbi:MAG: substrate-binding domain-containing protein, partial [Planctomycetaceae bacterium]|nr:substrate-binding domain-containing protein [Planctomycetaceae bacterium]
VQLRLVVPPALTWPGARPESSRKSTPSVPVVLEPADPNQASDQGQTLRTLLLPESDAKPPAKGRRRATAGRWLAVGATLLVLAAAGWVVGRGFWVAGSNAPRHMAAKPAADLAPALPEAKPQTIEINIAYGTEKKKWLLAAIEQFHGTLGARPITINPIGLGSVEGAHAILDGPGPTPIHVWSPASSAYRDVFESEWRIKHEKSPIVEEANLALTPMVFVMWKERHEAFVKKYKEVSFETIGRAMREPGGWTTIADKPSWGFFKFGHTHPNKSNSGLLTLVLMAYEFTGKVSNLSLADITQPAFQSWLQAFERGVSRPVGALTHSTGTLMEEMVLRGPSQYDCLVVYENLAIDYMAAARQHWGELHVVYPARSMWNEHPYYILDVPWSDVDHREAARTFLTFLMSEPIQRSALDHGFRPGDPSIPVRFPESPLVKNEKYGLMIEVPTMCSPPKAEVLRNLLGSFLRIER